MCNNNFHVSTFLKGKDFHKKNTKQNPIVIILQANILFKKSEINKKQSSK